MSWKAIFSERTHPSTREDIPSLESLGVVLHPDTLKYVDDPQALADSLGGNGLRDVFANKIVFAAAFSACMGGLLFGFDQGILSLVYVMPQFLAKFPKIDASVSSSASLNKGVMTGLLELGAVLGAFQSGFLADRFSRKLTIGIGSLWFIVGSVIQASAQTYAELVVGRFIGGVGIGILSSTAPMYISEIAPPNVRGAFLVLEGSSIVIGIVIMFYITYGTRYIDSDWAFRLPFAIQISPVILLLLGLWLLPFSPRWQAQAGHDRAALESLVRLRGLPITDPRVQAEWIQIRADAIQAREVIVDRHQEVASGGFKNDLKIEMYAWIDMFRPALFSRTVIGIILMFFQQFQGINALIYYSPTLFEELGLDPQMQIDMSGVLNIIQMVGTCSAFFFLDKVGRRPPLLIGAFCNMCCHFIVAGLIGKYNGKWADHQGAAWAGVAFIFGFMFFFGIGWSPVPWAMPAEVHSSSRRAKGVAIATCSNWLFNFIIGLITPPMLSGIKFGTFIFFGSFSLLGFLWTWFLCPETKGKTLEDMDAIFHTHQAAEEYQAQHEIIHVICGNASASGDQSSGTIEDKPANSERWLENA